MPLYALVNNATGTLVETRHEPDGWTAPAHKFGPGHPTQWVPVVDDEPPAHDPAAEYLTAGPAELRDGAWHRTQVALPRPVPEQVPLWALREVCALTTRAGQSVTIQAEIEAAIALLPEPNRSVALGRWERKDTIRRHDELTGALIQLLGLPDAEVDGYFRAAQARASA